MKKFVFVLIALFFALSVFAQEYRGMYVNSREGLNIRKSPGMSAEKLGALKYGEYISVAEFGESVTIDGIKAFWAKILVDQDGDNPADNYKTYGWVFSGYLQDECPMSEKEIIAYLKKLSAEEKDYFNSNYFPKNPAINYMQNSLADFEIDGAEWQKPNPKFSSALPNYACKYFENETENEIAAVRDCFIYYAPVAAAVYGNLRFVKAGTKLKVKGVASWGIENGTLFPIYWTDEYEYIRGIDFTSVDCVSKASDGNGGFHTLVYQQILEDVSMEDIKRDNRFEKEKLSAKEHFEKYFSREMTYEGKYLHGGFSVKFAEYTAPKGKKYGLNLGGKASRFKILYPLNMKNPVPIIQKSWFSGGMGGGAFSTMLSALEVRQSDVKLHGIFEYGYTSADAGFDGMAYHFFTKDYAVFYEYQTDEIGNVTSNMQESYAQRNGFPHIFAKDDETIGEPQGKSQNLKIGQYVNPICRLKLRQSPEISSRTLHLLKPGTLLKIVEVGERETIDGLRANWVKVQPVNDDKSVEGYVIKNWLPAEATAAWVFGAYLE